MLLEAIHTGGLGPRNECTKVAILTCGEQNWNFTTWCLWGCHFYKLEISKTGTLPQGISGVAVLVDQHIAKNCLVHAQFYSFKDSTKENKQYRSLQLSEFRKLTKHKWFTYRAQDFLHNLLKI